jgi:dTDP-4-amino-4,6-dideoxygalactose transaminase
VGVGPGDEVITASHSFIATANAIRYCGAVPVFADVQPDTYNMDPRCTEALITERTRAILVVHRLGMPCNLQEISAIASRHGLPLIEDAACASGSEIYWQGRWERIGRPHGLIACFSFHPRKIITTGDGGMLTTADPQLDRKFRLWRQHSMSVSDTARHSAKDVVFEQYPELGFNYRMTDVQAAIGRAQLARLSDIVAERRRLARKYDDMLSKIAGLQLPAEPAWARSNWQSYCVRLPRQLSQVGVMRAMLDEGIATRRGVMCSHREPAYEKEPWRSAEGPGALAHSEALTSHAIMLPLYVGMTDEDQERVVTALASALDRELRYATR